MSGYLCRRLTYRQPPKIESRTFGQQRNNGEEVAFLMADCSAFLLMTGRAELQDGSQNTSGFLLSGESQAYLMFCECSRWLLRVYCIARMGSFSATALVM